MSSCLKSYVKVQYVETLMLEYIVVKVYWLGWCLVINMLFLHNRVLLDSFSKTTEVHLLLSRFISIILISTTFYLSRQFCSWLINQYLSWLRYNTAACQRIPSQINRAGALQKILSQTPVGRGWFVWRVLSQTLLSAVLFSAMESYFLLFWMNFSKEKP